LYFIGAQSVIMCSCCAFLRERYVHAWVLSSANRFSQVSSEVFLEISALQFVCAAGATAAAGAFACRLGLLQPAFAVAVADKTVTEQLSVLCLLW
jgi:hypothetical protein